MKDNQRKAMFAKKKKPVGIRFDSANQICSICDKPFTLTGASAKHGLGSTDTKGNKILRNERLNQLAHRKCVEATGEDTSVLDR